METLYKVFGPRQIGPHKGGASFSYADYMPVLRKDGTWRSGKWLPAVTPVLCSAGYHYTTLEHLLKWIEVADGTVGIIETRGEIVAGDTKQAAAQIRIVQMTGWNEQRARLFAADCVEHILWLYEQVQNGDASLRATLETARRFARGQASQEELSAAESAARSAAWGAAESAARSAAWGAARSAAESAARSAAWGAARSAAWGAAESAARSAAWGAATNETAWQTQRLALYLQPSLPDPMPPVGVFVLPAEIAAFYGK